MTNNNLHWVKTKVGNVRLVIVGVALAGFTRKAFFSEREFRYFNFLRF